MSVCRRGFLNLITKEGMMLRNRMRMKVKEEGKDEQIVSG